MNSKRVLKNFLYSILSQGITICLGLVVPRLVLVGYGSIVNGLLNSVSQFIVYLNLFEAGIQAVALQALYKPVKLDDKKIINGILSAVDKNYKKTGVFYLGALLLLAAIYPFFVRGHELNYWDVFAVVLFSGLGNVVLFLYQGKYRILLQAEGKNYLLTNIQTLISILNNIAKIICLVIGLDVVVVVAASFFVSLAQALYIHSLIKMKYRWINLNEEPNHLSLEQKNYALIHQLAGMVFQNTDVLILTVFCGLKVVSVYSMYKIVTSHLGTLINSVFNSFSFALGQKFNTDKALYIKYIDIVEVYFSGIVFAIYTVACVLFIPFIGLYTQGVTDIQYTDKNVCLMFVVIELLTYSRLPQLNTINYAGHFKNTLHQTIIETVINLAVSLIAVFFLGIYGVLIGTICALLYRTIDVWLYSNVKILGRKATKTIAIYLIDVAVFVLLIIVCNSISISISSYWDFVLIGVVLAPIVLLVYTTILSVCFPKERNFIRWKIMSIALKKGA